MLLFKKRPKSKREILLHFIDTADQNCICNYYNDPYFSGTPRPLFYQYLDELSNEGYIRKMHRHAILKAKAYSYRKDSRMNFLKKLFSVLGRPVSYLISWILGIISTLIAQALIQIISMNP